MSDPHARTLLVVPNSSLDVRSDHQAVRTDILPLHKRLCRRASVNPYGLQISNFVAVILSVPEYGEAAAIGVRRMTFPPQDTNGLINPASDTMASLYTYTRETYGWCGAACVAPTDNYLLKKRVKPRQHC